MVTLSDVQTSVADLTTALTSISEELDVIQKKIDGLKAGSVMTQADLDALGASVDSAKQAAVDALSKETTVANS